MKKLVIIFLLVSSLAFANHKLTINLDSFSPHSGQQLQIRVVDLDTGLEVGRETIESIPGPSFSVDMFVLLPGHQYRVDIYADFNNNGEFDQAPVDHAWSFDLQDVQGDKQVAFTHTIQFSDIEFPPVVPLLDLVDNWTGEWENPTYDSDGMGTANVTLGDDNQVTLTLQAWGIFGNPEAVTYELTGTLNATLDTVHFETGLPWNGDIWMSDGKVWGTVGYESIGISATVQGHYGQGQIIVYYLMDGAFTAEEYAIGERKVETNTLVQDWQKIPQQYVVYDNYPNPFNPETRIQYELGVNADVELHIYNTSGQLLFSQQTQGQSPGQHSFLWNGIDQSGNQVSSGVYFYQLVFESTAGQFQEIRKMTLVK